MKKRKWYLILGGIITYIIGIGLFFSNMLMYMKRKDVEAVKKREEEAGRFNVASFQNLPQEEKWIHSKHGYRIHAVFVEPHKNSKKWMIIAHGITENKWNSIRYVNLFAKKGFNTVIYDHRRHGDSEGKTSSYGYYEKDDLAAIVAELKNQKGHDILLGIHGESMGAVTLLLYAGTVEDGADFYIADCPFSEFSEQIAYRLKEDFHLPKWMVLPFGDWWLKKRDGYSFREVSPLKAVENIKSPVLFIHSLEDAYIPSYMSEELYQHKKGPKQLYLPEKGQHAQSYNTNPEAYEEVIDSFLKAHVPPFF